MHLCISILHCDSSQGLFKVAIEISQKVRQKLTTKHGVSEDQIVECFANRDKGYLRDLREENQTNPITLWFIAETDYGRLLKIAFMEYPDKYVIKSAYDPNAEEIRIYTKYA